MSHKTKKPILQTSLRLLIVDDHEVILGGLEAMLYEAPGIESVATASDALTALNLCETFAPHIVLLDLRMPGMDGHSALERLSQDWPQVRVIILSGSDSAAEIKLAKRNGAAGFISKSSDPAGLLRIIHSIAAGGSYFPSSPTPDTNELSTRELEVLQHLVRGLTNEEIGRVLGVTGQTIKGHLKLMFPKLGVATRTEAVARAQERGLI
jgi:DNA-binding NarL/FixJ family response regulator